MSSITANSPVGCTRRLRRAARRSQSCACSGGEGFERGADGGRIPTGTEVNFGFGERVLCDGDTDHVRMIPTAARQLLALSSRQCLPLEAGTQPLTPKDAELLRKQVLDWKMEEEGGSLLLRRTWQARNAAAAAELVSRVESLVSSEGHCAQSSISDGSSVTISLSSALISGLSENDFIVAAKTDQLPLADLCVVKRKTTYFV